MYILPIEIINSLLDKFTFEYTEGSGRRMSNAHHILANMLLVLGKKRIAFLLQPIDYQDKRICKKILDLVLGTDQFIASETSQGYLITLNNRAHIDFIMEKDLDDDRELGLVLSYPCAGDLLSLEELERYGYRRQIGSANHIVTRSNQGDVMSNVCSSEENEVRFIEYFNDISNYISTVTQNKIELEYFMSRRRHV